MNAYALGCADEGLRKELMNMKDSGMEIEGLQTYGGGTSVKFKILAEEVKFYLSNWIFKLKNVLLLHFLN